MSVIVAKTFVAGWGDMDFNAHMKNTAYSDYAGTVRMMYFNEHGFPIEEFQRRRMGPVVFKDELSYFKEVHLLEEFTVRMFMDGLRSDGSRFRLLNEFFVGDKKVASIVTSGAFMSLSERKLIVPPEDLATVLRELERSAQFQEL
jgi:acyl-CoA thioester hydrolase